MKKLSLQKERDYLAGLSKDGKKIAKNKTAKILLGETRGRLASIAKSLQEASDKLTAGSKDALDLEDAWKYVNKTIPFMIKKLTSLQKQLKI